MPSIVVSRSQSINILLHVAVAVIRHPSRFRQILISQRSSCQHMGGKWEFPGGKVEKGESVEQAIIRELCEELGIEVSHQNITPLIKIPFHYTDKSVLLDVVEVSDFQGMEQGLEGQPLQWCSIDNLSELPFPPANRSIIRALQLPQYCLITGSWDEPEYDSLLCKHIISKLSSFPEGSFMLQWRAPDLLQKNQEKYRHLGQQLSEICHQSGVKCLLNSDIDGLDKTGADGVHLPFRLLSGYQQRPLDHSQLLGVSCHSPEEAEMAMKIDPDFITLSPVLPTSTHPGATSLGWQCFHQWVETIPVPVYALGGLGEKDCMISRQWGGQGVAMVSDWWQ